MIPLFDSDSLPRSNDRLEEGAVLLRGFATSEAPALIEEVTRIAQGAPFRHLLTPGGYTMSVAMTNCGRLGWVSDRTGYRYDPVDPGTGAPWPAMPAAFLDIAVRAAAEAGFANYDPDACRPYHQQDENREMRLCSSIAPKHPATQLVLFCYTQSWIASRLVPLPPTPPSQ